MLEVVKQIILGVIKRIPYLKILHETRWTSAPVSLKILFNQFVLRRNVAYWPIHPNSRVTGIEYIKIGVGTAPGISFGNYIFAKEDSPIIIGDYTIMAQNVCIAGYNHDLYDYREYTSKGGVRIGAYCWLAANSSIMPGVTLGDHTIVAANSVVTKSFSDGYCVIGGNPAKVIKYLEKNKCVQYKNEYEYHGYIKKKNFENFAKKHLKVD